MFSIVIQVETLQNSVGTMQQILFKVCSFAYVTQFSHSVQIQFEYCWLMLYVDSLSLFKPVITLNYAAYESFGTVSCLVNHSRSSLFLKIFIRNWDESWHPLSGTPDANELTTANSWITGITTYCSNVIDICPHMIVIVLQVFSVLTVQLTVACLLSSPDCHLAVLCAMPGTNRRLTFKSMPLVSCSTANFLARLWVHCAWYLLCTLLWRTHVQQSVLRNDWGTWGWMDGSFTSAVIGCKQKKLKKLK